MNLCFLLSRNLKHITYPSPGCFSKLVTSRSVSFLPVSFWVPQNGARFHPHPSPRRARSRRGLRRLGELQRLQQRGAGGGVHQQRQGGEARDEEDLKAARPAAAKRRASERKTPREWRAFGLGGIGQRVSESESPKWNQFLVEAKKWWFSF